MADLSIDLNSILVPIIIAAATFALTFYIKEYMQGRTDYSSLRKKLEKIAGKNATVLYNPFPGTTSSHLSVNLFQIQEINRHGVTLHNDMMTVYVPSAKLLQSEVILPSQNYDKARKEKMKKDMDEMIGAMVPTMLEKMFPELKRLFLGEFSDKSSDFSAVIGLRIQTALKEEGFEIKKLPEKGEDS